MLGSWSCDQVCSAEGLSCSEAQQHAHNNDVSTESGMAQILSMLGKNCSTYNSDWGSQPDVPCRSQTGQCFVSDSSRTADQYNCAEPGKGSPRLCWCNVQGNKVHGNMISCGTWIILFNPSLQLQGGGCLPSMAGHAIKCALQRDSVALRLGSMPSMPM